MARAKCVVTGADNPTHVRIDCPGCGHKHVLRVSGEQRPQWGWNGSLERPTFTPSIHMKTGHYCSGEPQPPHCWLCNTREPDDLACMVCHSFVTDGRIQFLADCTHALAGQTVDLPEIGEVAQ